LKHLLIGRHAIFVIESFMAQVLAGPGQRGLGYFCLHVSSKRYGIRSPDATLLACSFDTVVDRIERRGTHVLAELNHLDAIAIAQGVHAALYKDLPEEAQACGMTAIRLRDELYRHDILMAPDGDAAFDDGGHVLQFDLGEQVRLIAFKNPDGDEAGVHAIVEVHMNTDDFYDILASWKEQFMTQWHSALMAQEP
jgi:hypothetical protein